MIVASPAAAAAKLGTTTSSDGRWWVVVGSSPDPNYDGRNHAAADRAATAAKRCGVLAEPDFSGKWEGFAPGLFVQVAGGFKTRAQAERVRARVLPCVPDAYIREGAHAGD